MIKLISLLSQSATIFPFAVGHGSRFKLTCDGTTTRLLCGVFCLKGMTPTTHENDDTFLPQLPDLRDRTPSYAPTPGYLNRECTPSVICPSPDPEEIADERSFALRGSQSHQLGFQPVVDRESGANWDGQSADCVRYQIEWRVKLNNRVMAKDTEQDLVLPPSSYWEEIRKTAANVLRRKVARNRRVRADDTTLVVSVNDRSQCDLTKRFEGTGINWTTVENQLLMWAHLYRLGKKLRLHISINYIDDGGPHPSGSDKRGNSSLTKGMLTERDAEIDAEQASGQPSVWRDVYRTMRCPGPPCRHDGQYCWQDPNGKKHYKLRSNHMRTLVKYVDQGGIIETHDDIPDSLREQLYAEENQRLERRKKTTDNPATGLACPPINIHVLPAQSSQTSLPTFGTEFARPGPTKTDSIDIPGLLDKAVEEYATWHRSRVSSETFSENIQKARDVALENCLDLKQIYEDQDPGFFVKHGVKAGAARRFVSDIEYWVQRQGNNGREE